MCNVIKQLQVHFSVYFRGSPSPSSDLPQTKTTQRPAQNLKTSHMKKIQPVDHSLKPPRWQYIGKSARINICRQFEPRNSLLLNVL